MGDSAHLHHIDCFRVNKIEGHMDVTIHGQAGTRYKLSSGEKITWIFNLMEEFNLGRATSLNMNRGALMSDLGNTDPDGNKDISYKELERK